MGPRSLPSGPWRVAFGSRRVRRERRVKPVSHPVLRPEPVCRAAKTSHARSRVSCEGDGRPIPIPTRNRARSSPTTGLGSCRTSDPVDAPFVDLIGPGSAPSRPTCLSGWGQDRSPAVRGWSRLDHAEFAESAELNQYLIESFAQSRYAGRPRRATHDLAFRATGTARRAGGGLIPNSGDSGRLGLAAVVDRCVANSSDALGKRPRSRLPLPRRRSKTSESPPFARNPTRRRQPDRRRPRPALVQPGLRRRATAGATGRPRRRHEGVAGLNGPRHDATRRPDGEAVGSPSS
jgi:hypothetical protein